MQDSLLIVCSAGVQSFCAVILLTVDIQQLCVPFIIRDRYRDVRSVERIQHGGVGREGERAGVRVVRLFPKIDAGRVHGGEGDADLVRAFRPELIAGGAEAVQRTIERLELLASDGGIRGALRRKRHRLRARFAERVDALLRIAVQLVRVKPGRKIVDGGQHKGGLLLSDRAGPLVQRLAGSRQPGGQILQRLLLVAAVGLGRTTVRVKHGGHHRLGLAAQAAVRRPRPGRVVILARRIQQFLVQQGGIGAGGGN